MVLDCTFGNYRNSTVSICWWRGCEISVELAAASTIRMACAYFLASFGTAYLMPHFVWRTWPSQWTSRPPRMARPLQTHDARGAREVSSRDARRIRIQSVQRRRCSALGSISRSSKALAELSLRSKHTVHDRRTPCSGMSEHDLPRQVNSPESSTYPVQTFSGRWLSRDPLIPH